MTEWIDINDKLPPITRLDASWDEIKTVLFLTEHRKVTTGCYCGLNCFLFDNKIFVVNKHQATHWMPLPDPPKIKKNKKNSKTIDHIEANTHDEGVGKHPLTEVTVKLVGEDGNAYSILGKVRTALCRAGYDKVFIEEFVKKATSSDYANLLEVVSEYVHIE